MIKKILLSTALAYSLCAATFTLDKAHTNVEFSLKYAQLTTVKGNFKVFDADIEFSDGKFLVFNASIDVDSVFTNNEKRDNHLKQKDFFDTKENPKITFVMNKYTAKDATSGILSGELTMRGVKKQVEFIVSDIASVQKDSKTLLGFNMSLKLDRTDYKVGQGFGAAVAVGNEVKIETQVLAKEK